MVLDLNCIIIKTSYPIKPEMLVVCGIKILWYQVTLVWTITIAVSYGKKFPKPWFICVTLKPKDVLTKIKWS